MLMPKLLKYPLTMAAKVAARELVEAWDDDIVPQTMLFGSHRHGKVAVPMFFDLQGNQINYNKAPERGMMFEYAQFGLITLRTFREANTLEVILLQALRDAVLSDFVVSDYFLTLNSSGVLNMNGGIINIVDAPTHRPATHSLTRPVSSDALADTIRATLGTLPDDHDDLHAALDNLQRANNGNRSQALSATITALGRLLDQGTDDDEQVLWAVHLLTRHMGDT